MVGTKRSNRILALDLFRGYLLVVILIDHLAQFPGVFELMTGKGWLWSSAAEGFFIISGMMVGLIRGKDLRTQSFKQVWLKLWRRGGQLYLWSIGLTLAFTAIGSLFIGHADLKPGLASGIDWPTLVSQTVTFQYVYGWADFLSHYALCMLAAPFALYVLHRGWWRQLVAASLLVWWFRGDNFVAAWQLLFVGGMIAGHYLPLLESWVDRWSATTRRQVMRWWLGAAVATMAASVMVVHVRPWLLGLDMSNQGLNNAAWSLQYMADTTGPWFDKLSLAPGRVIVAGLWFVALYIVFRRYEKQLDRWLGWLLVPLGRNSLFVYITQSVVVFMVPLFLPSTTNVVVNLLLNILAILLIWRITLLYGHQQRTARAREAAVSGARQPDFRPVPVASQTYFQ